MSAKLNQKEIVRLREKPLKNGGFSLYLDIYMNGKRHYEFLKLYLIDARTPQEKEINKQTMIVAKAVQAKRTLEIQNGMFGFNAKDRSITLLEYFSKVIEEREDSLSYMTMKTWKRVRQCIEDFCKGKNVLLKDVDTSFLDNFASYLLGCGLSPNSAKLYNEKFRCVIRDAVKNGYIEHSVLDLSRNIKNQETERVYLTDEEVRKLVETPCKNDILKRAFLFSCLTGMRKSDILDLTWGNVQNISGYTRIVFKQRKTKGQMYLDITKQALSLMGKRGKSEDKVFPGLNVNSPVLYELRYWCMKAGITKDNIVFHSARHTFAVMALANGVDLYTVSKMLGHKKIETTQIYAKVIDKSIRQAVDKLPDILGDKKEESGK